MTASWPWDRARELAADWLMVAGGAALVASLFLTWSHQYPPSLRSLPAVLVITSVSDGEVPDRVLAEHCPEVVRGVFRKPLEIGALASEVERYLR